MLEMILPGVYITVNAEGLISPGQITTGNIGIIGTASKGPIGVPSRPIGSLAEAKQIYGMYDPWIDGQSGELTLVRALELAYNQGATTVFAVRVALTNPDGTTQAVAAWTTLKAEDGTEYVKLTALTEGTWGNSLSVNISPASKAPFVSNEQHPVDKTKPPSTIQLFRKGVARDARNRIRIGSRVPTITYDSDAPSGSVEIVTATGELKFPAGEEPQDTVIVSYAVDDQSKPPKAVDVTLRFGQAKEIYTVIDGNDLANKIGDKENSNSAWVYATVLNGITDDKAKPLVQSKNSTSNTPFLGGDNASALTTDAAANGVYETGLSALLDQDVQIIVAAGLNESFGNILDAHCQIASTDEVQRERIAVVGSKLLKGTYTFASILGHNIDSDCVILVAPGISVIDNAAVPPVDVTLPGAYAAAAVAGLLSSFEPHISLTNKVLPVDDLEQKYSRAELTQLLEARVLALESHLGFHIVRGITTSTNTAWQQITTRRIVHYAKRGVRSSADPYIGLLNNDRVRGALRATINSFLTDMLNAEMLVGYDLDVTATREQQIQGIVQVTMTLQPVFSIDFIQVTMYLQ